MKFCLLKKFSLLLNWILWIIVNESTICIATLPTFICARCIIFTSKASCQLHNIFVFLHWINLIAISVYTFFFWLLHFYCKVSCKNECNFFFQNAVNSVKNNWWLFLSHMIKKLKLRFCQFLFPFAQITHGGMV